MVLLSPMELDTTMRMILQVPIWAQRVIYIQGSCLKDADLARARMNEAEACFVLAARNYADKTAAVSGRQEARRPGAYRPGEGGGRSMSSDKEAIRGHTPYSPEQKFYLPYSPEKY